MFPSVFEGGLAVFRIPGFRNYWSALVAAGFATQIQTVAVGWMIYDRTRNPFDLGLVGLSQFLPALLLVLVTGAVADRYARRRIMGVSLGVMGLVAAGLFWLSSAPEAVAPIFALVAVFGASRAFYNPARQSLAPTLVPPEMLSQAITLNSNAAQLAVICGPVAGGLLYGIAPEVPFATAIVLYALAAVFVLRIPKPRAGSPRPAPTWDVLVAGFHYIWRTKVVLGAVSLDLFAVLLGGATALLPVYARDILDIGPAGLGLLRAAPAIGAISMGVLLVARPITDHAGRKMFVAVAIFGLATLIFSVSKLVWLSILCLIVIGASDMISVVIRTSLIQLWTPDELRGRVNAVNMTIVGASNELGEFRAGTMAAVIGPVAAVAVGGIGTLAVVVGWMRMFPGLAAVRDLAAEEGRR